MMADLDRKIRMGYGLPVPGEENLKTEEK